MRALVTPVLLLALAAAAIAGVFAVQRIEAGGSPIGAPTLTRLFSPDGNGISDVATLTLQLRERDRLDVRVVRDDDGTEVARLADDRPAGPGRVELQWDGTTADGDLAPEGDYRVFVQLHDVGRTFELPRAVELDVTPPEVELQRTSLRSRDERGARVRVVATVRGGVGGVRVELADGQRLSRRTTRVRVEQLQGKPDRITVDLLVPASRGGEGPVEAVLLVADPAGAQARVPLELPDPLPPAGGGGAG